MTTTLENRQIALDNTVAYADAAELWYANRLTIRGKEVPIKSFFALIRSFEEEGKVSSYLPENQSEHVYRPILAKDRNGIVISYFSTPPILDRNSSPQKELYEVTLEEFSFLPQQDLRTSKESFIFLLILLDKNDKPYQRILGYSILGLANYSTVEMEVKIRSP